MSVHIIKLKNQGFCYGVTRAIEIAMQAATDENLPKPIYLLGDIVHNEHISLLLASLSIITINGNNRLQMLDEVKDYSTVIFSAHGVSEKVKEKAKSKHLTIVDAICPYVEKTFKTIEDEINNGNEVFYIGKVNHPETEAVLELSTHAHLVDETILKGIDIDKPIKIANQTTMSKYDIAESYNALKTIYPKIELLDMVCKVTENRQKELMETLNNLNGDNNLTIIIGDKKSNNSTKLYELAQRCKNTKSLFIESIEDVELSYLRTFKNIVIASGTSTPMPLIDEVENTIKNLDNIKADRIKSQVNILDLATKK